MSLIGISHTVSPKEDCSATLRQHMHMCIYNNYT